MKKIIAVFALFAVLAGTGAAAFAWWDTLSVDETVTITVGEGVTISVSLEDQTTGNLVPSGAILKTGDVTSVVIDFDVQLDADVISALDLNVSIDNIEIGGDDTHAGLVTVTPSGATSIGGTTPVTVTLTVTLDMPTSEAIYNDIAGENITFDVTFTASAE